MAGFWKRLNDAMAQQSQYGTTIGGPGGFVETQILARTPEGREQLKGVTRLSGTLAAGALGASAGVVGAAMTAGGGRFLTGLATGESVGAARDAAALEGSLTLAGGAVLKGVGSYATKVAGTPAFEYSIWPKIPKVAGAVGRGVKSAAKSVAGVTEKTTGAAYRLWTQPSRIMSGKFLVTGAPTPLKETLWKGWSAPTSAKQVVKELGHVLFGPSAGVTLAARPVVSKMQEIKDRKGGEQSAAGAPKGSGEAMLSAAEELDRGTDAWVVREALKDLTAAGGTSNTEAVNAFRTRTKAIREKAVARMYPGWNEGISFENDLSAYRDYKDTEVGQKAGARLRSALERLNNMDPMKWVEGVK